MKKLNTYLTLVGVLLLLQNIDLHAQPFAQTDREASTAFNFGRNVSISGDFAVTGTPASVTTIAGTVTLYQRTGVGFNIWSPIKTITASDNAFSFGSSVFISGNQLIVGAPSQDGDGAAYIFDRNQGGANAWGQVKKLSASDGVARDGFGSSVAIDGNNAIVGAPRKDFPDGPFTDFDAGAVYFFSRNAPTAGAWGQIQSFQGFSNLGGLGVSVGIDGDFAAVGQNGGAAQVRIYQFNGSTWSQVALKGGGNLFANSVSVSNQTVIVGSPGESAAYIYSRNQGGTDAWGQEQRLSNAASQFGWSVGLSGNLAIVGANSARTIIFYDRFQGGPNVWGPILSHTSADFQFGRSVAISGPYSIIGTEARAVSFFGPNPNPIVPVELTTFEARPAGRQVQLDWSTSSEKNNSHFIVERSTDGSLFSAIGKVQGTGTTTEAQSYEFMDKHPAVGINYYRLQQVDWDGSTDYSDVEVVSLNSAHGQISQLYPNPNKNGHFQVDYFSPENEQIQVSVFDIRGKQVYATQIDVTEGKNPLPFQLNMLSSGIYLFQMEGKGFLERRKMVVR